MFTDIADHWGRESIIKTVEAGIMSGYGDGSFRPDEKLTRAELVVVMNRLLGISSLPKSTPRWADVNRAHWAFGAIQAASAEVEEK